MNKYLKYYYFDTLLVAIVLFLAYYFLLEQINIFWQFGSGTIYLTQSIFIIISIISLVLNTIFVLSRYNFKENNLLFPKYFLMFFILIIILGIIYNQFVFIKAIHFMYYLTFIMIGYAMLSIYTTLSFEKNKEITKKKNK